MNSDGNIKLYEDIKNMSKILQEDFIPIPDEDFEYVNYMDKEKRKKWWKKVVFTTHGKYNPHQGDKEKKRRLKQLQKGMLETNDILKD